MSVPVFKSVQTAARSGTTVTVTKPVSLAVGDLMIGYLVARSNNGHLFTAAAPAGWTTIQFSGAGTTDNEASFYKIADSADAVATNFVFTSVTDAFGSDDHGFAAIARITGANTVNPLDGINIGSVSATTSMSIGGITPAFTDLFIMIASHISASNGVTVSASNYAVANNNPSWTQQSTQSAGTADGNNLGQSMATASASASGATGNATATAGSSAGTHYLQIIAIKGSDSTITVSPSVVSLGSTGISPSTIQQVTVSVVSLVSAVIAPVISLVAAKWVNATKTTVASMTNTAKAAVASMTNTAKSVVSSFTNTSKS